MSVSIAGSQIGSIIGQESTGGGGAIGGAITGGTPYSVLAIDGAGNLANYANFTYSGTLLTLPSIYGTTAEFNEADVIHTPTAPVTGAITFTPDAGGFLANGTTYQLYVYSYYYDGTNYAYDSVGLFITNTDPNDSSNYNLDVSWDAGVDATGYLLLDFITGYWLDIGPSTSTTITPLTSWNMTSLPSLTPTSLTDAGHPYWSNKNSDWGTTDFNVLAMGLSGTNHLQFRWLYAGSGAAGGLRFESDDGVLRTINANIYGDTAYFGTAATIGTVSATNVNTTNASVSSISTKRVVFSSSGTLTGDAGFEYDSSTNNLLIASASFTAASKLHIDSGTSTASQIRLTAGSTTGQTSTDGLSLGITSTGLAEIRQYENLGLDIYTLNTLRASFAASASPRFSVFGGVDIQYNALANTSTDGLLISNLTSGTVGTPIQRAGRIHFYSNVYDTGAAATRVDDWIMQPVLTSANPATSYLSFERQYNGGGYTSYFQLTSAGALTLFGNVTLTPSGGGGSGANRTLSFGNGFANPAIYLYDAGATTRYGWGMQAGAMQFFAATATGNIFSWNYGGELNASGTNELMRLQQFVAGTGAGLGLGRSAFSPTTPYRIDIEGVTATTGSAGVEGFFRVNRAQTGGVSYPQAFSMALGRYSSSGLGPDSRVDFLLKSTAATNFTTDAGVMSLNANSRVLIGGVGAAGSNLEVIGSLQCDSITNDTGLAAGTYTPTLTNGTNVAASTAYACQYMRVGNTVTVSGKVDVDITATGAYELGVSLPIASNFTTEQQCAGIGLGITATPGNTDALYIKADTTNDRASINGNDNTTANQAHFFTFTYQVI